MNGHKRRLFIFKILHFLSKPFLKLKFNYSFDKINVSGPFILVCNHVTDYDPFLFMPVLPDFVYFVATENITRLGFLSKIIDFCFKPIIIYKGKKGINTVKQMLSLLSGGYNVAIFPEGNRTFNGVTCDFKETIGKVVKKSKATLVTYQFIGGYFTHPRWALTDRKGKLEGKLVNIYSPEYLNQMSDDEINSIIKNDIYVDAYKDQEIEKQKFRGKKLAYGMESCLFLCPKCKNIGTLKSNFNNIFCDCGFTANYDEYGYLDGVSITEYDLQQHDYILNNSVSFKDNVFMKQIDNNHNVICRDEVVLSADDKGFYINSKYINVTGLEIFSRNTMIIYIDDTQYNIKGEMGFNALKYKYLYEKI